MSSCSSGFHHYGKIQLVCHMRFKLYQVYSSSYTPVETPPTRERLQGPLDVDDKEQCELACDCARGELVLPECNTQT